MTNDIIVDQIEDLGPELSLGHMGVDVYQEIILKRLGLNRRMGEDVARICLDGDLAELFDCLFRSLQHRRPHLVFGPSGRADCQICPTCVIVTGIRGWLPTGARMVTIYLNCRKPRFVLSNFDVT